MSCPICQRRKPKRFCPAKGEKICAQCCGTEREVSIDCPSDCPYLIAARRYDAEHRAPPSPEAYPYPDVEVLPYLVQEHDRAVAGFALTLLDARQESAELTDRDALAALTALAETYRTLGSGIYYEHPPDATLPRALYDSLVRFLQIYKKEEKQHSGWPRLKDSEIFGLLVFLLRLGHDKTNGRPRSRAFLDFLRGQFPEAREFKRQTPRIITP